MKEHMSKTAMPADLKSNDLGIWFRSGKETNTVRPFRSKISDEDLTRHLFYESEGKDTARNRQTIQKNSYQVSKPPVLLI